MIKNHYGMSWHQIDNWAFWKTKQAQLEQVRALYDRVTCNMTEEQKGDLKDLIEWARSEAVHDDRFNSCE